MDKEDRRLFLMEQIFATVLSLANKLQSRGDMFCEDMTVRQIMAMMAILHIQENQATINNIAKKLASTKQSAKHIVNSLEKKNYVKVVPSSIDKRAVNVNVTEEGKEIVIKIMGKIDVFFDDISKNLNIQEMEQLWTLLKKLYSFDGQEIDGFEEAINYKLFNN